MFEGVGGGSSSFVASVVFLTTYYYVRRVRTRGRTKELGFLNFVSNSLNYIGVLSSAHPLLSSES